MFLKYQAPKKQQPFFGVKTDWKTEEKKCLRGKVGRPICPSWLTRVSTKRSMMFCKHTMTLLIQKEQTKAHTGEKFMIVRYLPSKTIYHFHHLLHYNILPKLSEKTKRIQTHLVSEISKAAWVAYLNIAWCVLTSVETQPLKGKRRTIYSSPYWGRRLIAEKSGS